MINLTIDLGTYSVKFIESRIDRKRIQHIQVKEIVIPSNAVNQAGSNPQLELAKEQLKIISAYLKNIPENMKVIFQCPIEMMSVRFINIPIKNLKKATLMIPFQLEEDIPYSLPEIHLINRIEKASNGYDSISCFCKKEHFEQYYQLLKDQQCLPTTLTHEISAFAELPKDHKLFDNKKNYCLLDIGHRTTKAYFYKNNKLVDFQISHIAGHVINEMLVGNYGVNQEQAIEFKHQNAFVLTPDQMSDVDLKQKEFAQKMDHCLSQLITDFKRWELSLRINHAVTIDQIYLIGGTSKLKNLDNYLAQKIGKATQLFEDSAGHYSLVGSNNVDLLPFFTIDSLSYAQFAKSNFHNLLTESYYQAKKSDLPIYSISYIAVRMAIVTFVAVFFLGLEKIFLTLEDQKINKIVRSSLESPIINIDKKDRLKLESNPEELLVKIKKKQKEIAKEIQILEEIKVFNATKGLQKISQYLRGTPCTLTEYRADTGGDHFASFSNCQAEELAKIESDIQKINFSDKEINKNENNIQIKFRL